MLYYDAMTFTAEALGSVIREHREAKGITQDDLGRAAGYGAGAGVSISRIESGITRPGRDKFEGIAHALGLKASDLEQAAIQHTALTASSASHGADASGADITKVRVGQGSGRERVKDRLKRLQRELEHRTTVIAELGTAFNDAHDRARDDFFMRFVEIAGGVSGAPQPDPTRLLDDEGPDDPESEATVRLKITSHGIAHVLAGGAGGAAAGAAVGSAAAYGTFMAAVSFGTASTGAAISGLSGAAATNAALALLGGGTLAAGGAGVAGGTMLLTGIVAAPALLLAVGGLVWMAKRNQKQQLELSKRLEEAEAEMSATRRGFEALIEILPRATDTLDYIATHAGHALGRWASQLPPAPTEWESLSEPEKRRYHDFIEIAASQLAVVTINVQDLMGLDGDDREHLIDFADEVLSQAQNVVETLV